MLKRTPNRPPAAVDYQWARVCQESEVHSTVLVFIVTPIGRLFNREKCGVELPRNWVSLDTAHDPVKLSYHEFW